MNGLVKWLKNIWNKFKKVRDSQYIEEITYDIDQPEHRRHYVQSLCDQIYYAKEELNRIKPEYEEIISLLSDYQKMEQIPFTYKEDIQRLAFEIQGYREERNQYQSSIQLDPKYSHLEAFEDKMPDILKKLKDAEERQTLIKRDIEHLEGEKAELSYKRNKIITSQSIVKVCTIVFFMLFSLFAVIFTLLMTLYDSDVLIPSIVLMIIAVFFAIFLFTFRKRNSYQIKKNDLQQKRAIDLLNKVKIKYVNNLNFIEYEYRRLKVNSYEELRYFFEQFLQQKEERKVYQKATNQLAILEEELLILFKELKIENPQHFLHSLEGHYNETVKRKKVEELNSIRMEFKNQISDQQECLEVALRQLEMLKNHSQETKKEIEAILAKNELFLKELDK